MTNIRNALMQAAGSASGDPVYVEDVFSTHLYTGTGSNLAINNGLDLSGEGGLVWVKSRVTRSHAFYDTERGTNSLLASNNSNAAATVGQYITYNNNGFTLTSQNNDQYSGEEYCSWSFRKQEGFFDVVTYTGNGSGDQTISHNLGSTPGFIAVKALNADSSWRVFHTGTGNTKFGYLNSNSDISAMADLNWNVTSTTFVADSQISLNTNARTYVAYLWASGTDSDSQIFGDDGDEAIIKCVGWTGNGSTQDIDLGFEPQWSMIKNATDAGYNWYMLDSMRGAGAVANSGNYLAADLSDSEGANASMWQTRANGVHLTNDDSWNKSGSTYIGIFIRRGPMKEPSAGTDVYNYQTRGGGGSGPPAYIFPHPVDWFLQRELGGTDDWYTSSRLIQGKYLKADETDATTNSTFRGIFDFQNGFGDGSGTASSQIAYAWRRYPKVFDTVVYEGNGSNSPFRTINHNLGVAPELVIIKNIDSSSNHWGTGFNTGNSDVDGRVVYLNLTGAYNGDGLTASATTVTLEGFGGTSAINTNGNTHLMLMFASLSGISKVGAYVGTGSAINVDCGFSGGARWVMVKRTDATADWYIVSSGRGFGKHLKVDSDADESSTAVLDTLSAGFTVRSDAGDDLNASGGKYLFLAFA